MSAYTNEEIEAIDPHEEVMEKLTRAVILADYIFGDRNHKIESSADSKEKINEIYASLIVRAQEKLASAGIAPAHKMETGTSRLAISPRASRGRN